jgi:hypothetical protein
MDQVTTPHRHCSSPPASDSLVWPRPSSCNKHISTTKFALGLFCLRALIDDKRLDDLAARRSEKHPTKRNRRADLGEFAVASDGRWRHRRRSSVVDWLRLSLMHVMSDTQRERWQQTTRKRGVRAYGVGNERLDQRDADSHKVWMRHPKLPNASAQIPNDFELLIAANNYAMQAAAKLSRTSEQLSDSECTTRPTEAYPSQAYLRDDVANESSQRHLH